MFFRRYPPDYAEAFGQLAAGFHWTPEVLEELGAEELAWWLDRLEAANAARARALRALGLR